MELSKRALGFLSRQYRIILTQNRLANALNTCALSALLCASVCATAAFVAPTDALAGNANDFIAGVTLPSDTTSWSSTEDMSVNSTSGKDVYGVVSAPTGPISITLNSGHTLNVTSMTTNTGGFAPETTGLAAIIDNSRDTGASTPHAINLTNNGTIKVMAKGIEVEALATGIVVIGGGATTITNNGTLDIMATGYNDEAGGDGIVVRGITSNVTNNGTINVTATGHGRKAPTTAILATGKGTNTVINNGTITVKGTQAGRGGDVNPYGIVAGGGSSTTITNNGTINMIATGPIDKEPPAAMLAMESDSAILTNNGTINVTGTTTRGYTGAKGMMATGTKNSITNAGAMNLSTTAKEGAPFAGGIGMSALGVNNTLINEASGRITFSATGESAEATGMHAHVQDRITDDFSDMSSKAPAITPPVERANTLINKGTITVAANGQSTGYHTSASGMLALGPQNTLTNRGTLNVSATMTGAPASNISFANAYGMYVTGKDTLVSTLNNFGAINVSATGNHTNAYQAYIQYGTANVGTWALKLGESYGTKSDTDRGAGYYVFGVGEGATLNFGLNDQEGAKLIISGLNGFESGVEYKISDMITIADGGTATGYIESITSSVPFLDLTLVDAGTASDYTDQSITGSVNITKDNSPTHGAATTTLAGATSHMNGLNNVVSGLRGNTGGAGVAQDDMHSAKSDTAMMYADASTTFTDAGGSYISPESPVWKAFLMPFYSTTSENGGAYNTDMTGLVVGANRNVGDDFVFGFHASLAKANSESTSTDSDTISYALGVNGVYNVDESLYFRGQLTGFYAVNDLDMVSGAGPLAQKAFADMDTYGLYAQLAAGYDFALAPAHVLTPELALSYMYAHMEGFNSEFTSAFGNTPFSMDSEDYNALYADASLRWTGAFDLGNRENGKSLGQLKPTVKAGVRQALTDPEISSTMNIFGESATTHADANETAFTCEAGLAWVMDDVTLSATYMGEFGDVEYSHMGMFKVEWEF